MWTSIVESSVRMRVWLRLCAAVALVAFASGCGGTKMQAQQPIGIKLQQNYADFVLCIRSVAHEEAGEEIVDLYKDIQERLKKRTQFQHYDTVNAIDFDGGQRTASRTLVAQVVITDIAKVSTAANVMFGMMAGTAHLSANFTLTDGATGQNLGGYTITSNAGTTSAVVGQTAKKIAVTIIDAYK